MTAPKYQGENIMIKPELIFPTHSDIAVVVGGHAIFKNNNDKIPTLYAVHVALDKTIDTMLVKIPWNNETIPQIRTLRHTMLNSPNYLCGVTFDNLKIESYNFITKDGKHVSGYKATASGIKEIIP